MQPSEVLQIAWEAILKNKIRSFLTMLGIIIGVAAVIIMVAISAGTEATIQEQITSLGSNLIYITANFSRMGPGMDTSGGLIYDDATAIADQISGVTGVVVEQDATETVKAGEVTLDSISITGTSPDFMNVRDLAVAAGRFYNDNDVSGTKKVAVLGYDLAQELSGGIPSGRPSWSVRPA
jgi:putative ABC transport system permease protein